MTSTSTTSALLPVYAQFPLRAVSGHGSWIVDEHGQRWLDAYGGHAVASTGHSHPHVVEAIARQAKELLFYSTVLPHHNRELLAEKLVGHMPGGLGHAFFCNSGAEANENAMTLARKRTGRTKIVSVQGGWHGRTVACLAVTDGAKYEAGAIRAGMALSPKVPFNDVAALARFIDDETAALIVEPVQGMSGARDCSREFLHAAREACTRHGAALIFDEIQCGTGRLGTFSAAEFYGVAADAVTMAKGLGSGFPIAAIVVSDFLADGVTTGDLGSTFGGGPLACAAGIATLEVMERERLFENAAAVGALLREAAIGMGLGVQGHGLLLGLRLGRPAGEVQKKLFERRILTGTASDPEILRLLPPLTFSRQEAELLVTGLRTALA
ncbi:MAG TPA: aminotransferase class III-fold pyridoxal phosphate-dependent enzyme [Gemmatimonadales bacterium]|nr:aminotransferase class III-fold pyridoxal phosphate-dependent enzyme [Gemmatimonadales bacterium]